MERVVRLEPESPDLLSKRSNEASGETATTSMLAARGKYRTGVRWLMVSGVVALLGITGWFAYQRFLKPMPTTLAVSLIPVKRGEVERTISESGVVELNQQQVLKSPEDVTVERVFVQAGDRVKAGAPLIILRNREDQRRQQEQSVDNQKALLDLVRKQEIVQEKVTKLHSAEQRLRTSQSLVSQGIIPGTKVQDDRDQVEIARGEMRDAKLEADKAALEVQKGQAALQDIQQRLGDNSLNTSIDALILQVEVKPGDGAKRETPLLTLGDPSHENVSLQLTTLNASKVKLNQVARVSMIGPQAKTFLGRVVRLSPQASSPKSENSFDAKPQAKVDAVVALDRPSHVLVPGSQVSVEIVLEQRRQVLLLPLEAIQQLEGTPFVWIKNHDGQAEKRRVKLGLQSLTTVEVRSGLQAGETVALPPPNEPLTPGTVLQESPVPVNASAPTP